MIAAHLLATAPHAVGAVDLNPIDYLAFLLSVLRYPIGLLIEHAEQGVRQLRAPARRSDPSASRWW